MEMTQQMPMNALEEAEVKRKANKALLWFGLTSIVMLFAGLTSAYLVRQGEGKWVEFSIPSTFAVSTLIILLSSVSMQWAVISAKKGNNANLKLGVLITLVLGLAFAGTQYMAWSELYHHGIVFTGRVSDIKTEFNYIPSGKETVAQAGDVGNVAGSFLYVITGLHVLHLIAGIFSLIIVFSRASRNKYTVENHNGVNICAIYWHFLDGLWLYLFLFLLYIR
jgi:cytochrome c oxidase subunit III